MMIFVTAMKTLLLQYFKNKGNCLEQYYTLIVIYFRYGFVSSAISAALSCVFITQGQSIPICCPYRVWGLWSFSHLYYKL